MSAPISRIFVTVDRGMTDKTSVCVYPWEKAILEQIHGGGVQEVTIDEMCDLKGPVKVEKVKHVRVLDDGKLPDSGLTLRQQLVDMAKVDPEDDPTQDPEAEYSRLIDKYGQDKEVPLPVVTRVYGEYISGAFAAALKAAREAAGTSKPIDEMNINELRAALRADGIEFDKKATKEELRDLLATATA